MIHKQTIFRLLVFPACLIGIVQVLFGALAKWVFNDGVSADFFIPAAVILVAAIGTTRVLPRMNISAINTLDAMLFAVSTWVSMGFLAAIPIYFIAEVSVSDSVFESISALTTTGATILSQLDDMPKSFLMYRQFLQWLGGLGVVIFVVAILPLLNVGGMTLLKAETPGPIKDDKLTPRTVNSAHYLWLVYVALTLACALAYYLAGMSMYDAIAHSFTTVSTGGFSTHDSSLGYFNSLSILWISNVFMILGAINFALHYRVFSQHKLAEYWRDEETRVFIGVIVAASLLITIGLLRDHHYSSEFVAFSQATFHLISFITSTGFGAGDYTDWPGYLALILLVAAYQGGCAGSTAGGNKIIRTTIAFKLLIHENHKLVHPNGVFTIKYQGKPIDAAVISAVIAFLSINAFISLVLTMAMMATGLDFYSALTAVAACINVLGPAFGQLSSNFQPVSDAGMWVLDFAMILGRLEFFTVLALLLPTFWRH